MSLSEYEAILHQVEKDIQEAVAFGRVLFGFFDNRGHLDQLEQPVRVALHTMRQSLQRSYALSVQRLLQGEGKATLCTLLKAAKNACKGRDLSEFEATLKGIRNSEVAKGIKAVRDDIIAHTGIGSERKKPFDFSPITGLLCSFDGEKDGGIVGFVAKVDVFVRGGNLQDVRKRIYDRQFLLYVDATDALFKHVLLPS